MFAKIGNWLKARWDEVRGSAVAFAGGVKSMMIEGWGSLRKGDVFRGIGVWVSMPIYGACILATGAAYVALSPIALVEGVVKLVVSEVKAGKGAREMKKAAAKAKKAAKATAKAAAEAAAK